MRILVLDPHGDDGIAGCGGTLVRYKNEEIMYVVVSNSVQSLPPDVTEEDFVREYETAIEIISPSSSIYSLRMPVRRFNEVRQDILEHFVMLYKDFKPDMVFTPSSTDIHQDHKTVYEESVRAFKKATILGYDFPWNNITFTSTSFVKLDKGIMRLKHKALEAYKSQEHRSYMNDDFMINLAKVRGNQIGVQYAEAFEVVRWII